MMTLNRTYSDQAEFIDAFGLETNVSLKPYTTFRIGGNADILALPKNRDELTALLKGALCISLPVTLIGGGSNLLISDNGIRGLVIVTCKMATPVTIETVDVKQIRLRVDAGFSLYRLIRFCADKGLSGLEALSGIPGTVGGAIMMNAGTPLAQISDSVESLEVWDSKTQRTRWLKKEGLPFSYRNLDFHGTIISARLLLKKADSKTVTDMIEETLKHKKESQPVSKASAGCFFKNPEQGMSAGELIDKAGMKGQCVNDAVVSVKHANYIVNEGNATCQDVLKLKQIIQKAVLKQFNINLEAEVRIEGE